MHTPITLRILTLVLCILMLCFAAQAEDARFSLEDSGLDLGIHSIHFPRFSEQSAEDDSLVQDINTLLDHALHSRDLTARLASVLSSAVPLISTWDGALYHDLLFAHLHVAGPIRRDFAESADYSVLIDLATRSVVPLSTFFQHPEDALSVLGEKLEWEIAPTLSPHLINAEILPLPETYGVSPWSVTLYYPASQLMTLSGNAGQVRFYWFELKDLLDLSEGSPAARLGVDSGYTLDSSSVDGIRVSVETGTFPSVPVKLGDALKDLVSEYPLLHDPDNITGARLFELEGAAMQNVQLITDDLYVNDYENSVVQGIRADVMCLYGLCTGETTQEEWRRVLGEPDSTVALDAASAELVRLVPGTSDYYAFGSHMLRLHADEQNILQSIMIQ